VCGLFLGEREGREDLEPIPPAQIEGPLSWFVNS
jgi:hypothetical protein